MVRYPSLSEDRCLSAKVPTTVADRLSVNDYHTCVCSEAGSEEDEGFLLGEVRWPRGCTKYRLILKRERDWKGREVFPPKTQSSKQETWSFHSLTQ